MKQLHSWGRFPPSRQRHRTLFWRHQIPLREFARKGSLLAYGLGRSYGDSCLNDRGELLLTRNLNRILSFDQKNGILRCEAGISLAEILEVVVPRGWFLPVSPGTKYVTLGGALANDIHGKNHHHAGTFGCHVRAFELLRSDRNKLLCSPDQNDEWFSATIGGLGLTGLVTWIEFQLKAIPGPWLRVTTVKFRGLNEFLDLSETADRSGEYTVAWVDGALKSPHELRGLMMIGQHTDHPVKPVTGKSGFTVPFLAPNWLLNPLVLRTFNRLYYHRQWTKKRSGITHYDPFFYPLDRLREWHRLYGSRGFLQYQCVVPDSDSLSEILREVGKSKRVSFLSVLKKFGNRVSPGMLSFPKPGFTLTMDFQVTPKALQLLDRLDRLVAGVNGAVYPAKDARMSAEAFRSFYPNWGAFVPFVDPAFKSGFWRRVTGEQKEA